MSLAALIPLATVIEVSELAETAVASLVAGVGVTFTFSVGIWGFAQSVDLRRAGRGGAALAAATVAAIGVLASVAAVIAGLYLMIMG